MREIEFRGQRVDNGEWVYGMPLESKFNCTYMLTKQGGLNADFIHSRYTILDSKDSIVVKTETIGQFTGMLDKNGNKIFEGDKFQGDEPGEFYIVNWNNEEAIFQMDLYGYSISIGEGSQEVYNNEISRIDSNCFELSALLSDVIIGNIHEDGNK